MILEMLGLFVLSVIIGWGSWQLIFKPLMKEYDTKMGVAEINDNQVTKDLNELEAEIELDIKLETPIKKDKTGILS